MMWPLSSNHYTTGTCLNLIQQIEMKEYILENMAAKLSY